jgi:hypothetical protein
VKDCERVHARQQDVEGFFFFVRSKIMLQFLKINYIIPFLISNFHTGLGLCSLVRRSSIYEY